MRVKMHGSRTSAALAAGALSLLVTVSACGAGDTGTAAQKTETVTVAADTMTHGAMNMSSLPHNRSQAALYKAMRALWEQHMEWTYATVSAFAVNSPGLDATLARLLRNQSDIGNAVKPFYGVKAGNKLTALLKTHINDAVPVLVAAKKGDTAAFNKAEKAWYSNAKDIADLLAAANPHWGKAAMEKMMKTHITQTTGYAADQLQGHYAKSIHDYGVAEAHMMRMSDMLSAGIIKQFPGKF